ncbi:MAG: helix-turn-helix domain-containing protein [Syntrophobacteria bacterium]
MKNLGEYLQAERQARGISLEQIAADTKISTNMLRAIEEGTTDKLPAPVLVKGFLRAYAKQIGLDPEAVVLQYQELRMDEDARQEALEKFHRRLRPSASRRRRLFYLLTLLLFTGLALFWWGSNYERRQQPPPLPATEEPPPAPEDAPAASPAPPVPGLSEDKSTPLQAPAPSTPGTGTEPAGQEPPVGSSEKRQPGAVSSVPATGEQAIPPPPAKPAYVLKAEALEPTWLRITIDEGREHEYMLQPGDRMRWQAASSFKLYIGNAAGLQLSLNNNPLKPLGESGEVVHIELPDPSLLIIPE